ncbi:MAG: hypothetical protein AB1330_10670 [Bacillota bacterium]
MEETRSLFVKLEEEFAGPFGPIPPEVVEHIRKHYGPCADRVLRESKDPRFCNPVLITHSGVTVSRAEEFLRRPWSVAEPEPGSLTEYYRRVGIIVPCEDGWKFKKGDGDDAFVGGAVCAAVRDDAGGACACSRAE